jgi:pilus assembly protein Flp/PilA
MIKRYLAREKGQGLVEYALILVLIAIVVIAVLTALGPRVGGVFSRVVSVLKNPGQAGGPTVSVSSISVHATATCNPVTGSCSGVSATASVSLVDEEGGPVSASTEVRFTNQGDGTQRTASGSGSISSGNLGGGPAGSVVQVCVVSVSGYTLVGGGCVQATYP